MSNSCDQARCEPRLDRQFGHPTGLLGRLIGHVMALEHRSLHRAMLERLDLSPDDRVLEIGFGPGTAIRLAAARAAFVAGMEISEVMLRQAARRNREAIAAGRVELRLASASALPYPEGQFSVVFEVNSLHHWDDPEKGLAKARRVLRPGGRFLLTLRGGLKGPIHGELEHLTELLSRVGLRRTEIEPHHLGHSGAFVLALAGAPRLP